MTTTGLPGVLVAGAAIEARRAYLRRVLGIASLGLLIAGATGVASMLFIASHPALLRGYGPMVIILGCWALIHFVARPMVFGQANKWAGFLLGTMTQGIALGFLLLVAVVVSRQDFGNPPALIGMALVLTVVAGLGITTYVLAEPRDFSLLRAGLSAVFLPMLVLMAVTFAFPNAISGTAGIVVAGLFVVISAAALLYQVNAVVHRFTTGMHVEGGYVIAIGVVVLFWNLLSLLMRMRRR
jgi:FtsH-binding integral membrane protein